MKLYPSIRQSVKRFHLNNTSEKMFHYRSGIFILFLWGHNFFSSLFPFSLPQFTFSLLPFLQNSAGSALFSPQEFYDSPTDCWDTKHSSCTRRDGRADKQGHKGLKEWGEKTQWRHSPEVIPTCHRKWLFAFQRKGGVARTCSAHLCSHLMLMSYILQA